MPIDPDLRRSVLSCLLLGFRGEQPQDWLLTALRDGLGGVVLFGSNVGTGDHVDRLTAQLRAAAGRDVVVALDEEGGDVTRLDTVRGSASPGAAALGHLDDPDATRAAYAAVGARLAEAGVTVDLAPVADVNTDPRNPVIGVRAFGSDPHLVARHVAAAVTGLQSTGVAACVKHFPGHGATVGDSHHESVTVPGDLDRLRAVELVPFTAGIDAGMRSVMTGHLLVPALDADRPATVSRAVTHDLLRGELGFTGTVLTDALEMRAVSATIGMVAGFVEALAAGADAIETGALAYPHLVDELPAAVHEAIGEGRLTRERVEDAARRTAALATRPAGGAAPVDTGLAARCLEVTGALPALSRPLVLEARPPDGMASGALPWSLADALARLLPGTEGVAVDEHAVPSAPPGRSLVVVVRDPQRHRWQQRLLDLADARPGSVVVDVGWPAELDVAAPVVRTRGVAPALLAAVAARLAGAQVLR